MKGKKEGDRSELLTKNEMDKLLLVVSSDSYFYTLYTLLLHTGRRIGEVYGTYRDKKITGGIRVKDIDFENKTIITNILKTKKRKLQVECIKCKNKTTYKNKFCPYCGVSLPTINRDKLKYDVVEQKQISLKDNVIFLLKKYIHDNKLSKSQYLFREKSLIFIKKKIKKHIKQAGITKNFSLHGFRHYFITQCKRAGMTNEQIALWTGHKRPETLNIYNRMVPKEIEDKILDIEL